jgi:predicted tellurium resistance membrane protein TerC
MRGRQLLSLSVLEIVLGIDNLVFIALLTSGLEERKARLARRTGLALAFLFRVVMLATLTWLVGLTQPFFFLFTLGSPGAISFSSAAASSLLEKPHMKFIAKSKEPRTTRRSPSGRACRHRPDRYLDLVPQRSALIAPISSWAHSMLSAGEGTTNIRQARV